MSYPCRPLMDRFMDKFMVDESSGCWNWTAAKYKFGHGKIMGPKQKVLAAHRVSWEIHVGAIPDGMCVLHKCDNPGCVNPKHLFLGTKDDNNKDCQKKGRHGSISKPGSMPSGAEHWVHNKPHRIARGSRKDGNFFAKG